MTAALLGHTGGAWTPDPLATGLLAGMIGLYALVVGRLWRRPGGRGIEVRHIAAFGAGSAALAAALVSPLDALAIELLSAHMVQHVLIANVAAPLLVYGTPLARLPGALAASARRDLHRLRGALGQRTGAIPFGVVVSLALAAHASALWAWHVPALYERAAASTALHALEHVTFLLTGMLVWFAVLGTGRAVPASGARILCLFLLALQGAALGALMTFASAPWYPGYAAAADARQIDALADQQLAGLVMWGFGAVAPVVVAAALLVTWLDALGNGSRGSPAASSHRATGTSQRAS